MKILKLKLIKLIHITILNFIYKTLKAVYYTLKDGIVKVVTTNLDGQVVLIDIMSSEGAFLHPYNFHGTPQAVYLLPVSSRNSTSSLPITNPNIAALPL